MSRLHGGEAQKTQRLCQRASQVVKRALSSSALRREAVLGPAPSPEKPWHSGTAVPPARGTLAADVRSKQSRCRAGRAGWVCPCPAPGGPSLTGVQRLDHGHLIRLWRRVFLLGRSHPLPGNPGAAGGSLCHPEKWRKVCGEWGDSLRETPQRCGAAEGGSERYGLPSGSPPQLHALLCPVAVLSNTAGPHPCWLYSAPWGVTEGGHKGPHSDPLPRPGGDRCPLQGVGSRETACH